MENILLPLENFFGQLWPLVWSIVKIVLILIPLFLGVAYMTYAERKIIGAMQVRIGPNRVGPFGLLQPIADTVKLLFKEVILPLRANKLLYILGPVLALGPALVAWAVVPFADGWVYADINAGLLFLLAVTSVEVYGIIISGWASNSKYAMLGAMRATAQMISYEVALSFALLAVLMTSSSLNLGDIVASQGQGIGRDLGLSFLSWNWLPLLPMFVVYIISGIAETNRSPFDTVEGESEIVAGHMIEYSGMAFALFFLGEYANMILVSAMTAVLFLGGWLSPVSFLPDGFFWFALKMSAMLWLFLWARATFPRFRYDHTMRLGWKVFIPVTLVWLFVLAVWMMTPLSLWK